MSLSLPAKMAPPTKVWAAPNPPGVVVYQAEGDCLQAMTDQRELVRQAARSVRARPHSAARPVQSVDR